MKLSKRLVIRAINEVFSTDFPLPEETILTLGRPVFHENAENWPSGHICLCTDFSSMDQNQRIPVTSLVFVCPNSGTDSVRNDGSGSVFFMPEGVSLLHLFNQLQILFDKYEEWDHTLSTLIQNEANIQALLDASFPVFGNPLILRASDFLLLSYSSIITENNQLNHLIDPSLSIETLKNSRTDANFVKTRKNREPFFLSEEVSGSRELCCNLFLHNSFSHRLVLSEQLQPIHSEMAPLLAHLASYLQSILQHEEGQNTDDDSHPLEELLRDIISKRESDIGQIKTSLASYNWYEAHQYCCLNVKLSSFDRQQMTSRFLCHHFEEVVQGSCAFRYGNELVIFVNLTHFDSTIDDMINRVIPFLRDSFLKTGISTVIQGVADLQHIYQQSRIALSTGSRVQNYRWIHRFEDISVPYLMECCSRDLPRHMLSSQKLMTLREYDQLHKSDFYNTLRVYLNNNLNAVQTSRELFIHRSTFLYRLDRIRELTGIDFEDHNMIFYLMISYHLMDLN